MQSLPCVLLIWLFYVYFQKLIPPCDSVSCLQSQMEEGQEGILGCDGPHTKSNLTWLLQKDGKLITVSACSLKSECLDLAEGFSGYQRITPTSFNARLKIRRANKEENIFKCVADGGEEELVCNIEIYVKPETPRCTSPVSHSITEVAISCSTERVFPEAVCEFSYTNYKMFVPGHIVYQNAESENSPGDKTTNCTLIMNVSGNKSSNYYLALEMYPKLTKVPSLARVRSQHVPVISLRAPSVAIAADCPKGPSLNGSYIESTFGELTTCRCELTDKGFPQGQAVWYDKDGSVRGDKDAADGSATLNLRFNPNDPKPIYTCLGFTFLNTQISAVKYRPMFAIGPNLVYLAISEEDYDLCPSNIENVTITCIVPTNQVNPEPTFSIIIDSHFHAARQTGQLTSSGYVYSYVFRPQTEGTSKITCWSENSAFPHVKTWKTVTIKVVVKCGGYMWDNVYIIVGLSVGTGGLALLFAVIIFIVIRRKRARSASTYVAEWANIQSNQEAVGLDNPQRCLNWGNVATFDQSDPPNSIDCYETIEPHDHVYGPSGPRPHTIDHFTNIYIEPLP